MKKNLKHLLFGGCIVCLFVSCVVTGNKGGNSGISRFMECILSVNNNYQTYLASASSKIDRDKCFEEL